MLRLKIVDYFVFYSYYNKFDGVAPPILRKELCYVVPRGLRTYGEAMRCVYVPGMSNLLRDEIYDATSKRQPKSF